jgi:hypothetical protein
MLRIRPNLESKSCQSISYLLDITVDKFREKISCAVLLLCKEARRFANRELCWNWLYVLPLYDFMSKSCEPFASLEYNPEKILANFNARARQCGYHDDFLQTIPPRLNYGRPGQKALYRR